MKRGFTLIEMLVVVLIIGILAGVGWPKYTRAIEKTRTTEAMQMIKALNDGVYTYAAERNSCPPSFKKLLVDVVGDLNADGTVITGKDFSYHLNAATNFPIPGTGCGGVVAKRIHKGYELWNPYKIVNETTKARTIACTGTGEDAIAFCKGLGVYTTEKPYN